MARIDEEAEMLRIGRTLILMLVALLALAALVTIAFAPGMLFPTQDDEAVRRNDDSSDVYTVSDEMTTARKTHLLTTLALISTRTANGATARSAITRPLCDDKKPHV